MLMRKWKPPYIPALEDWAVVSYSMVDINFSQVESENELEDNLFLGCGSESGNCGESLFGWQPYGTSEAGKMYG